MSLRQTCARLLQACVLAAALLSGCSLLPPDGAGGTPSPSAAAEVTSATGAEGAVETPALATPAEVTAAPDPGSPATMRVWLPPQFSPDPDTPGGSLLAARLEEFALLHPGIRITVRIKAETGPGGMVSSLAATTGAVAEALPDLVLLPRAEMERAAGAGLIAPFQEPLDTDWYDFGRSLASLGSDVYGLPLAADALVLLYRPTDILDPPNDWTTTLNAGAGLLFAAGSPEAYFTFALYEAAGGRLVDDGGRPFIDAATLTAVLEFYAAGAAAGILPSTAVQLPSEAGVFQAFLSGESAMAVSWVSNLFLNPTEGVASAGLPTVTSVPYTLVSGWMWSLSNPDPERQRLAAELAAYLSAPDFMAVWTQAAGLLPARPSALAAWPDSTAAAEASRIVLSAHPIPGLDVIETSGPALQQAIAAVLAGDLSPLEAAQAAADRVNAP